MRVNLRLFLGAALAGAVVAAVVRGGWLTRPVPVTDLPAHAHPAGHP